MTLISGSVESGIFSYNELIISRSVVDVESYLNETYGQMYYKYIKPNYPAFLAIDDLILDEPSGNNILDGREKGSIKFSLSNNGKGFATKIEIALLPLKTDVGLIYNSKLTIDRLDSN